MKPVQKSNVSQQLMMPQQQGISDEQAIQIMNKIRTKGNAAQIAVDEIVSEMGQLFVTVVNQKNNEIAAFKESLAKKEIEDKLKK